MSKSPDDLQFLSEIEIKEEEIVESQLEPPDPDPQEEIIGFSIQEIEEDPEANRHVVHEEFVKLPAAPKPTSIVYQLQTSNTVKFQCEICAEIFTNLETLANHKNIHEEMTHCQVCSNKIMKKFLKHHMETKHTLYFLKSLREEAKKRRKRKKSEGEGEETAGGGKCRRKMSKTYCVDSDSDNCDSSSDGEEPLDSDELEEVAEKIAKIKRKKIAVQKFMIAPPKPPVASQAEPQYFSSVPQISFQITEVQSLPAEEVPSSLNCDEVIEIEDDSEDENSSGNFQCNSSGSKGGSSSSKSGTNRKSESDSETKQQSSTKTRKTPRKKPEVKFSDSDSQSEDPAVPFEFVCEVCSKSYQKISSLRAHRRSQHRKQHCPYCSRRFYTSESLDEHMLSHGQCQYCGITVKNSKVLKEHLKTHREWTEAKYHCSVCNASFTNKTNLIQHEATHGLKIVYTIDGEVKKQKMKR